MYFKDRLKGLFKPELLAATTSNNTDQAKTSQSQGAWLRNAVGSGSGSTVSWVCTTLEEGYVNLTITGVENASHVVRRETWDSAVTNSGVEDRPVQLWSWSWVGRHRWESRTRIVSSEDVASRASANRRENGVSESIASNTIGDVVATSTRIRVENTTTSGSSYQVPSSELFTIGWGVENVEEAVDVVIDDRNRSSRGERSRTSYGYSDGECYKTFH